MTRTGTMKRALLILLALMLTLSCAASFAETTRKLTPNSIKKSFTVGVSQCDELLFDDSSAVPSGYIVEYFDLLSQYASDRLSTDLTFKFVKADGYYELERMLVQGDIDFIAANMHTDSVCLRPGKHTTAFLKDFCNLDHSIAFLRYALFTLRDDNTYMYEDFSSFSGMDIGVVDERNNIELLNRFADTNKFTYNRHVYGSGEELLRALNSGEVQAVVADYYSSQFTRMIAQLDNVHIYICGSNARSDSTQYLNRLQAYLYEDRPYVNYELTTKYFGDGGGSFPALTADQRDYLNANSPIRIAACADDAPNSFFDETTGEFHGAYIDILNALCVHSGIEFKLVPAQTQNEALDMLRTGVVQAVLGVYSLSKLEKAYDITFTRPFLSKRIAVVGRSGTTVSEDELHTVGISGNRTAELVSYIREYFPSWRETYYDSVDECFDALAAGDIDFAVFDGDSVTSLSIEQRNGDASVISSLDYEAGIAIALSAGAPQELIGAIDSGVLSLTSAEIMTSQMVNSYKHTNDVAQVLKELAPYILMAVVLVVAVFAVLIISAEHKQHYAEQKATFFANMSHEIRTPINGIMGMAQLIKKNSESPVRVGDCANKILYASNHLLTIINDILDQSKLDNGMMRLVSEEFDIKSMLSMLHSVYGNQAKDVNKRFDTIVTSLPDEFYVGDETRIHQILMNLLSNAFKFTEENDEITLRVRERAESARGATLVFSVSDTGRGIAPEKLSAIFNAYEQESARDATVHGGTGLGLSISRNLARLMGGDLTVKSIVGVGSTFTLTVPAKPVRKLESITKDAITGSALIVDSDEESRVFLYSVLSDLGLEVRCATAPVEAIAMLQLSAENGTPYSYCFFDWSLLSGDSVKSMATVGGDGLRKIAISSLDYSEICDAVTRSGADAFIGKPIFLSVVREVLLNLNSKDAPHGLDKYGETTPELSGRHVLIVEDNKLNMEIVEELVSLTGAHTTCADNGAEAVDLFKKSEPGYFDLILMDVQMPVMDGYEATRSIRALARPDAKLVSIIAMTANIFSEDVERAIGAGMDSHIAKPIDLRLLYAALERFSASR